MRSATITTWAHGVVVSHPLRMRKALGSIPSVSTFALVLFLTSCGTKHLSTSSQMAAGRHGVVEAGWVRVGRRRACGSPVFALATCSHHATCMGRSELAPFSGVATRITNRCSTVRNARLAQSAGRKALNLVVVGACPPHIQAGGARRRVWVVALVGLLDATEAPMWGSSPRPRLRSACSTSWLRRELKHW